MEKKIYEGAQLICLLQSVNELENGICPEGILSLNNHQLRFEETVKKSYERNDKLFDGSFCSLVHRRDGKYQIHMKAIDAEAVIDWKELADKVHNEIVQALKCMD